MSDTLKILRVCASSLFAKTALLPEIDYLLENGWSVDIAFPEDQSTESLVKKGYKIIYDPAPSVFHHHGIDHSNNTSRVKYIRNILTGSKINKKTKKVICMIPILKPVKLKNRFLIEKAINEVLKLKQIYKVFIVCDDKELIKKLSNKKILFLNRGEDLKKDFLGKNYVLKEVYNKFIKRFFAYIIIFFLTSMSSSSELLLN